MAISRNYRIIRVFGVFLILLACLILVSAGPSTRAGAVVVALGLGLLGLDAVIASIRKRPPFASRIRL